ncbi:IPT/TIG domain-containing protein [Myxococcota bacterium]|nr:IPT/TIG domain-containing protein [Myxococcota bacterium]
MKVLRSLSILLVTGLLVLSGALAACGGSSNPTDSNLDDIDDPDNSFPTISLVLPDHGQAGITIEIQGTLFQDGASVSFGSTDSVSVNFVTAEKLEALVPDAVGTPTVSVTVNNPDGGTVTLDSAFTYEVDDTPVVTGIDQAFLQSPASLTVDTDSSLNVYGRVLVDGVTDAVGKGANIEAQAGIGVSSDDVSTWNFVSAAYTIDTDSDLSDEYMVTLTAPAIAGDYLYAYRFRIDQGPWEYADLNGTADGFSIANAGVLTVEEPFVTPVASVIYEPRKSLLNLTEGAWVRLEMEILIDSVTAGVGEGAGVSVDVGWAVPGTAITEGGWNWTPATYTEDSGDKDIYAVEFNVAYDIGSNAFKDYIVMGRVKVGSEEWVAVNMERTGAPVPMEVWKSLSGVGVNWCGTITESVTVGVDDTSEAIYGEIYIANYTGIDKQGTTPKAQLGWGPEGDEPDTWSDVNFTGGTVNPYFDGAANNDEVYASLNIPNVGTFDMAWRFSTDDGATWVYCDKYSDLNNDYDAADMAKIIVEQ